MFRASKILRTLLLASFLCFAVSTHAYAEAEPFFGPGDHGGSHPWPWGHEVPFPWDDIQGIWQINKPGKPVFLSFRRLDAKRLAVNQFDLETCEVIAGGPGLEREKTVVSQMNEFGTPNIYRLTLYAFDAKDSPEPPLKKGEFDNGRVMVVRINSLRTPSQELAFQMVKISDGLEIRCPRQNKFLRF